MNAHVRTHRKKALALATALGITAGMCAATAGTATAAAPAAGNATASDEVVIPDPGRFQPRGEELTQAGSTGYAHRQEGTAGYLWTDAETGATKPITEEQAKGHSGLYAKVEADPAVSLDRVTVTDVATGQERLALTLPAARHFSGAFTTDTVVTTTRSDDYRYTGFQLLQVVDGKTVERPVTGFEGTFEELRLVGQDAEGALFSTWQEGHLVEGGYYLDYATATLSPWSGSEGVGIQLGTDHLGIYNFVENRISTAPRSQPKASVETQLPKPLDGATSFDSVAIIGDWIVLAQAVPEHRESFVVGEKLQAVRIGTGEVVELLPHATTKLTAAPDGSLLVVGGDSATDWAVRRVSLSANGTPQVATVRKVPQVPTYYAGLALGGGRVNYLSTNVSGIDTLGLHDVDTDLSATPPTAGTPQLRARIIAPTGQGLFSTGDGDSVYADGKRLYARIDATTSRTAELPVSNAHVVDAAGRYVLAESGTTKYVADLENYDGNVPDVKRTITDSAAALWDAKVWQPTATAGQVNSYNLKTGSTSAPLDLGSGCKPTELQAVGRWLYWACGAAKAGVYDHTEKKSVTVPTGEALLGDGYVVRHVEDELQLTNLLTGATSQLADLPAAAMGSGRRQSWTVDKFGSGVAYVDAAKNVHVKKVAVAAQPLAPLTHSVEPLTFEGTGVEPQAATWSPVWRFSKAVGSWELRIAKGNGEGVRTFTGTQGTGGAVRVKWDGKDAQGRGVESGQYRWELIARPLDGTGPVHSSFGAFDVNGSSLTTVPGTYTPVTPTRLMDTRDGTGVPKAKVGPGGTVSLRVAGKAGVPAEGVTAVVLNVTATNATADSFVSVYPNDTLRTSASNLNFKAGRTVPNLVTVPVVNGYVEFYNKSGSVDLLADVSGYYAEGTAGSEYQPVTPKRLMDTREGTGVPKAKVGAGGTVTLPVTEPGVTAVALNVTATNPTATSFVSVYPYGTARGASNLNFVAGQTVPNLVIVPVKDGKVTFYNHAGTVDLIADVAGYYKDGTGSVFTGMQPKRVLDTRTGTGVPAGKVGAGKTVTLTVGTKYTAVVMNVTATEPTAAGFVSVYPYGTTRTASNLNFVAGQTVPNLVVVPVKDGKVTFYNHTGTVHLIADVAGYFTG
ncbi:FlgD immunoglobulin-like domain containing protein [Streptomyces sp. NPDC006464]|uniref:FlgD immunoglobulin-like domain containing protein n=1 Tax=Streptomyces sp. NPDC006464 TaxID=3154305 RepID=UPI0033BF6D24